MNGVEPELVVAWVEAVRRPDVAADLESVYAATSAEIEKRAPVCWASGRCCNFRKTGHLLYVTGLEAAYTLVRQGSPGEARLAASVTDGGCPFQVLNRCGVHADKPLGCRLYFCDRATLPWQHDLYELLLGRLRGLHTKHGLEYRYGEWRGMMRSVMQHEGVGAWSAPSDEGGGPVRLTVGGA